MKLDLNTTSRVGTDNSPPTQLRTAGLHVRGQTAANQWSRRRVTYLVDLFLELISRETKLIYKRSALGVAWTLLNPILQLSVLFFVFHTNLAIGIKHYATFLYSGLLFWNWFQVSLTQSTGTVVTNAALLKQPAFSPSILPIAVVATWFIHLLVAVPVLLGLMLIEGLPIRQTILVMPLIVGLQFLFTLVLAYPLAALFVTFRDIQHILSVLLNFLFYMTPIFYSVSSVAPQCRWIYNFNPMCTFVQSYRDILIAGVQPNWSALMIIAVATVCLLPLSRHIFKVRSARFVEEL